MFHSLWTNTLYILGKNYAGIGSNRVVGREISECIYRCCLYAGIDVNGSTAEVIFNLFAF